MAVSRDLEFQSAPLTGAPLNLVFGPDSLLIRARTITADFTVDSDVTVDAFASGVSKVNAEFTIDSDVTVEATTFYDNRVTRYVGEPVRGTMAPAVPKEHDSTSDWQTSTVNLGGTVMSHQTAVKAGEGVLAGHGLADFKPQHVAQRWELGVGQSNSAAAAHETAIPQRNSRSGSWELGVQHGIDSASAFQKGIFKLLEKVAKHEVGKPVVMNFGAVAGASVHYTGLTFFVGPWGIAGNPAPGASTHPPVTPLPPRFWWSSNLVFEFPQDGSPNLVFNDSYTAQPVSVVVPVRSIYMVANSASLRRVDGNIYLPTFSMSLSLDTSSWTWGFTATLPGSTLASLEPASNGAPVEVEALINGVPYRALIEGISRNRSFGKSDISVTGRGKTSLLDAPYAPVKNFGNTGTRNASQLIDDVLTVNGVPMGWTVNFGLEDWSVPADVFNHQGSYISAINAIAGAAGGYVQPHATGQVLNVLPKYPTAPWNWGSTTPDYTLPADVTTTESIEWVEKARYNRVFVSGVRSGVLGQVTRAGTDGSVLAPMVTDALITHAIPARTRGLSVLADTGRIANVKLRLPVLAETGIITPGKMVRYVDGSTTRNGIVRSVGVEVGMPEIWQTIGVETHVN